jgi:diguanylate cyclase (GGDEF)-like protein
MLAAIAGTIAVVYGLDWATDLPFVQHLYYLPISLAAFVFGMTGGTGVAVLAILLYHLANRHVFGWPYGEFDVLQMSVFIAIGVVVARLAETTRRLHALAMTDDLTGLHNLRSFELHLSRIVREAAREGTCVSLLVLDVDRLKLVNDTYGHLAGAGAVQTVGRIIAKHIPPAGVACRYGGDEFAIALPSCSGAEAEHVANELRHRVETCSAVLAGSRFVPGSLSISIGAASSTLRRSPAAAEGWEDVAAEALFRAADGALYEAKASGRNRVRLAAAHLTT